MSSLQKTWSKAGALPPFFYRFQEDETDFYGKPQLIQNIIYEISRLLNTRSSVSLEEYKTLDPDNLDHGVPGLYGLPDFSFFDGSNKISWPQISHFIETSLRLFEPRLKEAKVHLKEFLSDTQDLEMSISGTIRVGNIVEFISFPVSIQGLPAHQILSR